MAIQAAINEGTPTYNEGDHEGCFNIYVECSAELLAACPLRDVQGLLQAALRQCGTQRSHTERAWTMRHAFDAILGGGIDTDAVVDLEGTAENSGAADAGMAHYRDACVAIQTAIDEGAPTFNDGDHAGCFNVYAQCAEGLVA